MSLTGLKSRCQGGCIPSGNSGGKYTLGLADSRGTPRSMAHTPPPITVLLSHFFSLPCLPLSLLRTTLGHPDNPGYSPNFKILNLITSQSPILPRKVTQLQVPGIKRHIFRGHNFTITTRRGLSVRSEGKAWFGQHTLPHSTWHIISPQSTLIHN